MIDRNQGLPPSCGGPTVSSPRASAVALIVFLAFATLAHADDWTRSLLDRALPAAGSAPLHDVGRGLGMVFSPDLSVPGNCDFYAALGFACFESSDWQAVIDDVHQYNDTHADTPIRTLVLEAHGTNGNGLKLQAGKEPSSARSYISVGGLQERLESAGVTLVILSACNSGRLLRPSIYRNLDPPNGGKLFLPATLGILGASPEWKPTETRVQVVTPASSQVEAMLIGELRELDSRTRNALQATAASRETSAPAQFAVSDMLIRMLTRDPQLRLRTGQHVEKLSATISTPAESERLFRRFIQWLATAPLS